MGKIDVMFVIKLYLSTERLISGCMSSYEADHRTENY